MATRFACSFNIVHIYQAFILLFHKGSASPPPLFLSLSVHLSLPLSVVPHPVFLISCLCLRFGGVYVLSCNLKLFAVRHIHYPGNPSSDHFHIDAAVPSSDHCCTETIQPPSDHYCIDTEAPSGDHYCIDIVVTSRDHCCNKTVPPSSERLTK